MYWVGLSWNTERRLPLVFKFIILNFYFTIWLKIVFWNFLNINFMYSNDRYLYNASLICIIYFIFKLFRNWIRWVSVWGRCQSKNAPNDLFTDCNSYSRNIFAVTPRTQVVHRRKNERFPTHLVKMKTANLGDVLIVLQRNLFGACSGSSKVPRIYLKLGIYQSDDFIYLL